MPRLAHRGGRSDARRAFPVRWAFFAVMAVLLAGGVIPRVATGQAAPAPAPAQTPAPVPAPPPTPPVAQGERYAPGTEAAARARADSARARTARRLRALSALPDSERVEALDQALEELGGAIESISRELSTLDLQVEDQTISLRDRESGGQVRINIPPDIGEQISRGISSITATILADLPDTLVVPGRHGTAHLGKGGFADSLAKSLSGHTLVLPKHFLPPPPRVIGGDIVRVFGDVRVEADEEVAGSAIAVFGDVTVSGHVNGDAVAVFGRLRLAPSARVAGDALAIGGVLERDETAKVQGSVFALDSGLSKRLGGSGKLLWGGWLALALRGALFAVAVVLLALVFAFMPRERLEAVAGVLRDRPGACIGHGALWLFAGHLLVGFLAGVLVLTIIGIPLALLLAVAYAGLAVLAVGIASWPLGRRIMAAWGGAPAGPFIPTLIGLLVLHLPGLLGALVGLGPGPDVLAVAFGVLGIGVKLVAFAFGLGALVLSRFGGRPVLISPAAGAAGDAVPI